MKAWEIRSAEDRITEAAVAESATKLIPSNSVLLVVRSGILKHTLPVAINRVPVAINQDLKALCCGADVLPEYLAHFLRWTAPRLLGQARATTADNLPVDLLRKTRVPTPPLPEQRRIATILDKADAVRRKRQEAIRLKEDLLGSVFLEMFGDPVTNPKRWPLARLKDCVVAIEAGQSVIGEERTRASGEWAVLKISAVTSCWYVPSECKVVRAPPTPTKLVIPRRGDLIFSRANTRELVAATCLVDCDDDRLFLPDKLWRVVADPRVACVEYLRYLFATPSFRSRIASRATGTSGSMLNVSQEKVLGLSAPLPPLALQGQFADVVRGSHDLRRRHEIAVARSDSLFDSLVQRAFQGTL